MFKNLKSLFIEEVNEGPKKEQNTPSKTTVKQASTTKKTPLSANAGLKPSAGKATTKFMEILFKAMEDNDLDGFDYLEFKHSLKSLEKMPMDEATRFKSAFAMAQTMNATPAQLIKTANHYMNVLKQEEEKFNQALVNQRAKQIGNKEQQLTQLEATIKTKTQQIKNLTAEITKHQKTMDQVKQQVAKASVKVESTKNDFEASFNVVVSQIAKDIENMKKYLK